MPIDDLCPWCRGEKTVMDIPASMNTDSVVMKACGRCGGEGVVPPYRKSLPMHEAHLHGWTEINSWPRMGRKGHCQVCDDKLTGRQVSYCGERWCRGALWGRLYEGVHWQKRHVCVRDGCACRECGEKFESSLVDGGPLFPEPRMVQLDHIVPLHKGGTEHPDNLQLLCERCHLEKSVSERRKPFADGGLLLEGQA